MKHKKLIVSEDDYPRYLAALRNQGTRMKDIHTIGEIAQRLKDLPFIDDGSDVNDTDDFTPGKGHAMSVGGKPVAIPHPLDQHAKTPRLADQPITPKPGPQDAGLIVTPDSMKPPTTK